MPLEVQAIEEHASDGHACPRGLDVPRTREPHARLETLEAGASALILGNDLAVEQESGYGEGAQRVGDLGIAARDVLSASAGQLDLIVLAPGKHSHAVVLDLEAPLGARGRMRGQSGQRERDLARRCVAARRIQGPDPIPNRGDRAGHVAHLLDGQAGDHGLGIPIDRFILGRGPVGLLEKQPLFLLLPHAHESPSAPQLEPEQLQLHLAARILLERILGLERAEPAAIPYDHRSSAVVAGRDHPLEVPVLERMILDVHREPLLLDTGRRPLGHRPTLEHALQLEPQIEVHVARPVLLHDETGARRGNGAAGRGRIARAKRFGRADGIALAAVVFEMGVAGFTHGMASAPAPRPLGRGLSGRYRTWR